MWRIVLNGRFLEQQVTGVQRAAREILREIDGRAASGAMDLDLAVPRSAAILSAMDLGAARLRRVGSRRGHLWEQATLSLIAGTDMLLCLGNSAPLPRLIFRPGPTVTMVHDLSDIYFPGSYRGRYRAFRAVATPVILRRSDGIVTVSESEKAAMTDRFPFLGKHPHFRALQNGGLADALRDSVLAEPAPPMKDRRHGLYVGSLTARKNFPGVLRAAIAFLRRYPNARFVVIGANGANFSSIDLDVPEDVAPRLDFLGQVNDERRIHQAYREALFLLFPSLYEASPLPPIEAMSFGCPVIASRIPSLVERCGEAALYCDAQDGPGIDAAIGQLMNSSDLWRDYSGRGRRHVLRFSWREQTEQLLDLCARIARARQGGTG